MLSISFGNSTKITIINFLINLIPLSLIIGNSATNLNIFLICLMGIYIYKKEIFYINQQIYKYLIYSFFLYLILITLLNNWPYFSVNELYKLHFFKSIFFLRMLLFFLVINKLIEKNDFNIKNFFLSCSLFSIIIAVDILYQFTFKENLIGYEITHSKPSSFFNEENIAGGFLQKFLLIFLFYIVSLKKNKNYLNLFILIISIILLVPIILTGNKMPMIIYLSSIIFYFLIEKKVKYFFMSMLIIVTILFCITKINTSERYNVGIKNFFNETKDLIFKSPNLFINNPDNFVYSWRTGYLIHYNTGVQIWKTNKIFGNGLKSFRLKCTYEKNQTCNTHPHNYFIELMVDTGMIGIILIYSIYILGLINFYKYYIKEKNINTRLVKVVFFILIFFELFPLRSTGSFFTTNNSVFIFLILAIFLNFKKINNLHDIRKN